MYSLLIALIVLASILMCGIVLIQNSKGGGLAAGFASSNQIMGVRKTTDVIEKTTWGLAIAMVILSVLAAYAMPTAQEENSVLQKQAVEQQSANPYNPAAAFPAAPATDADGAGTTAAPATDGNAAEQAAPAADGAGQAAAPK